MELRTRHRCCLVDLRDSPRFRYSFHKASGSQTIFQRPLGIVACRSRSSTLIAKDGVGIDAVVKTVPSLTQRGSPGWALNDGIPTVVQETLEKTVRAWADNPNRLRPGRSRPRNCSHLYFSGLSSNRPPDERRGTHAPQDEPGRLSPLRSEARGGVPSALSISGSRRYHQQRCAHWRHGDGWRPRSSPVKGSLL